MGAAGPLVSQIMETNRADIIEVGAEHLRAGVSVDELMYVAFSAGIRASSFRMHSNHPCKMIEAARQLSNATSGVERERAEMSAVEPSAPRCA